MAIEYINTGTIANDGTGDALREAMIKINNNFEELDLRDSSSISIENVGTVGEGIYAGETSGIQGFKKLIAGSNVSIAANDTTLTIDVVDSLEDLLIIANNGSLTVLPNQSFNLVGGDGINTSVSGQTIDISLDTTNIVSRDTAPTLASALNANSQNIINVSEINADLFRGPLEGLVYGYDIRNFGDFFEGFDFGSFRTTYASAIQFITQNLDVDFGPIDPERTDLTVDLGIL